MKRVMLFMLCSAVVLMMGCYGASIDTGRPASNQVIKKSFASSWIYGLVPPPTVETAAKCPNGIARVETRLSFVNQLVAFLTGGIYTPMEIIVTCAEASNASLTNPDVDIIVPKEATAEEVRQAFAGAADRAAQSGSAVFVRLDQ